MKELKSVFEDTMYYVEKTLTAHNVYLQASTWKSLPELTNSGGQVSGLHLTYRISIYIFRNCIPNYHEFIHIITSI